IRMTRRIKRRWHSDLLYVEGQLIGDDLRQRGGVALARIETAGKHRDAAVGFQSDARRLALPAEQLRATADEHAVTQVRAAGFDRGRDADAEQAAALPALGLLAPELFVIDGGERLAQHLRIIAAVIGLAGGRVVGKLIRLDEVAKTDFRAIDLKLPGYCVDHSFYRKAHKGFADAAIGDHGAAVGHDRIAFIGNRAQA